MEILDNIISAIKQTSITEWAIFITAIIYVLLAAIENKWCWPFGIISSLLSVYLCYIGQLFLESGLSIFYVLIGVYGWYQWLYGSTGKYKLKINSFSLNKNLILLLIGVIVWLPLAFLAKKYSTQALPFLDAFITSFSLIATWMTAKKIIENWLYWIIIDGLAIILNSNRGFYLIALLYGMYSIIAFVGYIKWKKTINI